jgi:hypothetical protein
VVSGIVRFEQSDTRAERRRFIAVGNLVVCGGSKSLTPRSQSAKITKNHYAPRPISTQAAKFFALFTIQTCTAKDLTPPDDL